MTNAADIQFEGFPPEALKFLKALGFHQNREWFAENKGLYDSAIKAPMGAFLDAASARLADTDIKLQGTQKTSMFRVNRDVRFAKNKDPYNTHASAVLTRNGTKKDNSGAYIHIKPENCLFAAGIWFPDGQELRALREAIIDKRDDFLKIEAALNADGLHFDSDKALKRVPPAFKEIEDEELKRLLKQKSFVVTRHLKDSDIESPDCLNTMLDLVEKTAPLMNFAWRVMDPLRETNEQ